MVEPLNLDPKSPSLEFLAYGFGLGPSVQGLWFRGLRAEGLGLGVYGLGRPSAKVGVCSALRFGAEGLCTIMRGLYQRNPKP